ncbi:MAG: cysteine synthase family protein [Candidatus Micrarchaeia archaeon]
MAIEKRPGILSAIGNTPLVELVKLNPSRPRVRILLKLEGHNPTGSLKDRIALYMIEKAEERGELTDGKTVLEATSGNTGISLAMVCAVKGYPFVACMSERESVERRKIMKALGAEIILTPAEQGTDGAIRKADELAAAHPEKYFVPRQHSNPDNALAHYETTGPEIWAQARGDVDVFIAGIGTTGTLMGVGRFLKEKNPRVRVIGVEPAEKHRLYGLRNLTAAMVPPIFDPSLLDDKVRVSDEHAYRLTRELARAEGIFAGISTGAVVWAALEAAKSLGRGTIVALSPDRGDKYLSIPDLF